LDIQIISASLALKRLETGEALLLKVKKEVEFLLYFKLAFDFIDLGELAPSLGFDKIVGVY